MPEITIDQAIAIAIQHQQAGRLHEADALCRQILALQPDHGNALHLAGALAGLGGRPEEAIELFRRAIAVYPNAAEFHFNLAVAPAHLRRAEAAAEEYCHALRLEPGRHAAHNNLAHIRKDQGLLDEALAGYERAIALQPDNAMYQSNRLYMLHFHPGYDAAALYAEHVAWNRRHAERYRPLIQSHRNTKEPERRLRVGYVSPDLRTHPVGRFLLPLLRCHDHQKFEIFCYADVRFPDELTNQLRGHADVWRTIAGLSDEQVAQLVRQDQVDILVDLSMHMANNRLLAFARKPSVVQVTYLAYCSTTGLETMDYRLTDPYLDPPGETDGHYAEVSIRLAETSGSYEPNPQSPDVGPLPALAAGRITFGCLNNFAKVSPAAFKTWSRLLKRVPRSRLLLHAREGSHRQRVLDLLRLEEIDPQRVNFVGFVAGGAYFQLYQEIDLCLDPFPYAGGTTTFDALWMGVPVVSLAGKTAVGRGGKSMLFNVGLAELVAGSEDQYVTIAAELAEDVPRLMELRAGLRDRMRRSPLMDGERLAENVEAAFRDMWRRWCSGSTLPR